VSGLIASTALRPEDLPAKEDRRGRAVFASTFDGYAWAGGRPEELGRRVAPLATAFARDRALPAGADADLLRAALFFVQRGERFTDPDLAGASAPDADRVRRLQFADPDVDPTPARRELEHYKAALVERLRELLEDR
jgi:hypothetical protein